MPDPTSNSTQWKDCTIRIHITFEPGEPGDRTVVLTATTDQDFPICQVISERDLGKLPIPLRKLLKQLKKELPNRLQARQAKETKPQPKPNNHTSNPTPSARPSPEHEQISLF